LGCFPNFIVPDQVHCIENYEQLFVDLHEFIRSIGLFVPLQAISLKQTQKIYTENTYLINFSGTSLI
jgi:hypothetical protein